MTASPPEGRTVVLIRHGETEWSRSGRHTGRTDLPLTAAGRDQAAAVAPRLAGDHFALVLTSPLSRALDTCTLAGLSGESSDDLLEWDYGEYEGLTSPQIREHRPDWWLWTDGCPGGEMGADVAARADRVIARCRAVDGAVALVAHGHLLRVLAARWIGEPHALGGGLGLSTAAICELGYERTTPVITRWNDTTHLTGLSV